MVNINGLPEFDKELHTEDLCEVLYKLRDLDVEIRQIAGNDLADQMQDLVTEIFEQLRAE